MNRTTLPLLLLLACRGPESGLDKSVITGSVVIPPGAYDEVETRQSTNDELATAFNIGPDDSPSLTYRAVVVGGEAEDFLLTERGQLYGDPDHFAFSPIAEGDFTITLTLGGTMGPVPPPTPTTGDDTGTTGDDTGTAGDDTGTTGDDTGTPAPVYVDAVVFDLVVYDAADGSEVYRANTDGAGGVLVATFPVVAGGDYVVLIGGVHSTTEEVPAQYTAVFSGSTPGDETILVGAYAEGDPAVGSNPLGGASVGAWTWDAPTLTWTGTYEIQFIRGVDGPVLDSGFDPVTDPYPNPTIDEQVDLVYLMAGTLTSLNATPAAGALYSVTSVEVAVNHAGVEVESPLVLDGTFPKVIGIVTAESQPDTTIAELNADYTLNLDTLVSQDIGMLSGLGYVDILDGSSVLDPATAGWGGGNDSDAFAFTVPESVLVRMSAAWADVAADLDFGIWGDFPPYGTIDYFSSFSDSYCLTGANPEICETIVPLEPGITYYLVALGYLGTDEQAYHVELEWVAP